MSFHARPSPYRSYVANTRMLIDEENMTEDHLPLYSDEAASMLPNSYSLASSLASASSRQGSRTSSLGRASSRVSSLASASSRPGSLLHQGSLASASPRPSSLPRPSSRANSYNGSSHHSYASSRGSSSSLSPADHLNYRSPSIESHHSSMLPSLSPISHFSNRFSGSPVRANSFTPVDFGENSDTQIDSRESAYEHRATSPDVYSGESHMLLGPDVDSHVPHSHSVYDDTIDAIETLQTKLEFNAQMLDYHAQDDPNSPYVFRLERKQRKIQDQIEHLQTSMGVNVKRSKASSRLY